MTLYSVLRIVDFTDAIVFGVALLHFGVTSLFGAIKRRVGSRGEAPTLPMARLATRSRDRG